MILNTEIDQIKQSVSILDLVSASGLTVVQRGNKFSTQEHNSLILYPQTNSWSWFSQADQHGKILGGDVFAWCQQHYGCNFADAHEVLSRMVGTLPPATVTEAHRETHLISEQKDYREFATKCWQRIQIAEGEPVAMYLINRGVTLDTAKSWGIGAHKHKGLGWAVTFPYTNVYGQTVVNMRLIERVNGDKCRHYGQRGGLFGAKLAQSHEHKYLFAVEGELNAVSISQSSAWLGVDVVSFGNNSLCELAANQLITLASGYSRLFIWTDEATDTKRILDSVPGAIGYKSPQVDGKKFDANDMIQRGVLTAYIATVIERHADQQDTQRLYSMLYRRHKEFATGLDEATLAVAERIAMTIAQRADLTSYIGRTVDTGTWQIIEHESKRRHGDSWVWSTQQSGDQVHISRLTARPDSEEGAHNHEFQQDECQ